MSNHQRTRCLPLAVLYLALSSGPAAGQTPAADLIHIPGSTVQPIPLAEWEVPTREATGPQVARIRIAEGEAAVARAPSDATRYSAKEYVFPMGALRVLTFERDAGPVVHQITFETELFLLAGSATVGVGDEVVAIEAGDAVFLPSGVLRNDQPKEDTIVALFYVHQTADEPAAAVVRSRDVEAVRIAQYVRDGEAVTATKQSDLAKAPEDAGVFDLRRYAFGGNSIRHARLFAGGKTTPATNSRSDILIYITKGRMRRIEDGKTYEVVAGDAIREEFGKTGHWELLEESEFLATNMFFDPSKPKSNPSRTDADVGVGYE